MPVPPVLRTHLQYYLGAVRPALLNGRTADQLWISNRHGPITGHSLYILMTNFTQKTFGFSVSPHRFRHTGATSIIVAAPEQTEPARAFLGHGDYATTEDHYVVAHSLTASRERAALVTKLRRALPGASAPMADE